MNRYRILPDADGLLARMAALSDTEIKALQNAYYYRWLQLTLRANGWLNLVLGGFTLLLGLSGLDYGILKVIQTLFGVVIVGVSLWGLLKPSRDAIFGYSIMFALAGAWNIFLGVRGGFVGIDLFGLVLGIFQVRWAYQFYQLYSQKLPASIAKPDQDIRALYDALWQEFAQTRRVINDQLLEMIFGRDRWRGFTFGDYVALASPKTKLIIFAHKSEFNFAANNANGRSKRLKGHFQFHELSNRAAMDRSFYERYLQWRSGAALA